MPTLTNRLRMKNTNRLQITLPLLLVGFSLGGPSATAQEAGRAVPEPVTVSGLDASGAEPVYFSFAKGDTVGADESWDVSFKGTAIAVSGAALVIDRAFSRIVEAPESGYREDGVDEPAIPVAGEQRWFDYDMTTHVVTPVPFRTILIRTKSGGYAKMEVVDFYDPTGEPRFYTIRYAYQPAGSRVLGSDEG